MISNLLNASLFHYNRGNFPELQRPEQSVLEANLCFVNRVENQGIFRFVNQIMPRVFMPHFGSQFPRVLNELKNYLQLIPQTRLGD